MQWIVAVIAVVLIAAFVFTRRAGASPAEANEAAEWLRQGAPMIDVRTPGEFAEQSVPGSVNIPLQGLQEGVAKAGFAKDQPLLVFCLSGGRSTAATHQLKSLGFTKVINIGSFDSAQRLWQANRAAAGEPDAGGAD